VTTSAGAEGIGADDADGLFVRERPEELSRCVLELLADGAAADRLGDRARRFVAEHFSWDAAGRALEAVVEAWWESRPERGEDNSDTTTVKR
jgi:glycosyltransferase involved in cell wall biosynthesis